MYVTLLTVTQRGPGLEEPFVRGNPTGCSLSNRKCHCRFEGTEQVCWAEALIKDRVSGMYNKSWTVRLLGQSIALAMQPSEELAINRHFKVRKPHNIYHDQSSFKYVPRKDLSWIEYNPAVLAASGSSAASTLFNIRQGGGEHLNLSGVAQTSVVWVADGRRGRAKVKLEIRNAEDARPFVLNGTAHAIFIRSSQCTWRPPRLVYITKPLVTQGRGGREVRRAGRRALLHGHKRESRASNMVHAQLQGVPSQITYALRGVPR